jgi:hypothetical protein
LRIEQCGSLCQPVPEPDCRANRHVTEIKSNAHIEPSRKAVMPAYTEAATAAGRRDGVKACFQKTERGRPRPQQCPHNESFRQFQAAWRFQVCCARGRARSNSILKTRPNALWRIAKDNFF